MNLRSGVTSILSLWAFFSSSKLSSRRSLKTSAIATSLIGPCLDVWRALLTAPVPRPPQPMSAIRIRSLPAAWTDGTTTPARAEAVAAVPVVFRKSRRDAPGFVSVMLSTPWRERCDAQEGFAQAGLSVKSLQPPGIGSDAGRRSDARLGGRDPGSARLAIKLEGKTIFDVNLKFNMRSGQSPVASQHA